VLIPMCQTGPSMGDRRIGIRDLGQFGIVGLASFSVTSPRSKRAGEDP